MKGLRRRGVASLVGTMFFVIVFVIALGAQAYVSGLQKESGDAVEQAQQVLVRKGAESLTFTGAGASVQAWNGGGATENVQYIVLRFANGTTYSLSAVTASIPPGGSRTVASMVPSGACGGTTCTQKFDLIATGSAQGSIGAVTSLGNSFWLTPLSSQTGGDEATYWTTAKQSTSSTSYIPITGLGFTGASGGFYLVHVQIGYYQTTATSPGISFAASFPAGATMLACGGIDNPDATVQCTGSANTPIGTSVFTGDSVLAANYCTSSSNPCLYLADVKLSLVSAGTFQMEFRITGATTGSVIADSIITVVKAG